MGYKQTDVARLLGFKNTTRISQWERGMATPSMINLLKLSIIYRTLINEFYFDVMQELKEELAENERSFFGEMAPEEDTIRYTF